MVFVKIFETKNGFAGFSMKGHADFDEEGFDIVCSAVSVLAINTVNSIEKFTETPFTVDQKEDGGYLKMLLRSDRDSDSQLLMKALVNGLADIAESYPDNLRVETIQEVLLSC